MTRETKVGIVVSCSFVGLVGVVIASKLREEPPPSSQEQAMSSPADEKTAAVRSRAPGTGQFDPGRMKAKGSSTTPKAPPQADAEPYPPFGGFPKSDGLVPPRPLEGVWRVPGSPAVAESKPPGGDPAPLPKPSDAPVSGATENNDNPLMDAVAQLANEAKGEGPAPLAPPSAVLASGPVPPPATSPEAGGVAPSAPAPALGVDAATVPAPPIKSTGGGSVDLTPPPPPPAMSPPAPPSAAAPADAAKPAPVPAALEQPASAAPMTTPTAPTVVGESTGKQPETLTSPPPSAVGVSPPPSTPTPASPPAVAEAPLVPVPVPRKEPVKKEVPREVSPAAPTVVAATPILPVPPVGARPTVESFTEQEYVVKAADTFESISKQFYQTPDYAEALRLYNRNDSLLSDLGRDGSGALKPGQHLSIPQWEILKKRYGDAIPGVRPAGTTAPATGPETSNKVPVPPKEAALPASKPVTYLVPAGDGQWMYELAKKLLGNGDRWTEIRNLNRQYDPGFKIPAGKEVRLPADARVAAVAGQP